MTTASLTTVALFFSAVAASQAADDMKAFPVAEEGMSRYVLRLPKQDDETALQVELIVGKMVQVDERNRYFFSGKIEELTIKGWGFPRYIVSPLGPMVGTLIAVEPNAPKVARFIKLRGDPYLIRYNSRLPVVIYAPESSEVRYRIWRADGEMNAMENG